MYIGLEAGCHDVPEPIAPIEIMFVSLEPMPIPMSSPRIISSGPMSISCISSVAGIACVGDGAGELAGIACVGDGAGELAGVGVALGFGI
jgi:hypothetical protein